MNDLQLEMGNIMLKYFAKKGGRANTDDWDNCEELKDYPYLERGFVRTLLEQRGFLIPMDESRYWDMLTEKGWKAVKAGSIEKYLHQEEEKEKNKYVDIRNSNLNFGINTGLQVTNETFPSYSLNEMTSNKKSWLKTISLIAGSIAAMVTIIYYVHALLK